MFDSLLLGDLTREFAVVRCGGWKIADFGLSAWLGAGGVGVRSASRACEPPLPSFCPIQGVDVGGGEVLNQTPGPVLSPPPRLWRSSSTLLVALARPGNSWQPSPSVRRLHHPLLHHLTLHAVLRARSPTGSFLCHFSVHAKHLVSRLLDPNPATRLSVLEGAGSPKPPR